MINLRSLGKEIKTSEQKKKKMKELHEKLLYSLGCIKKSINCIEKMIEKNNRSNSSLLEIEEYETNMFMEDENEEDYFVMSNLQLEKNAIQQEIDTEISSLEDQKLQLEYDFVDILENCYEEIINYLTNHRLQTIYYPQKTKKKFKDMEDQKMGIKLYFEKLAEKRGEIRITNIKKCNSDLDDLFNSPKSQETETDSDEQNYEDLNNPISQIMLFGSTIVESISSDVFLNSKLFKNSFSSHWFNLRNLLISYSENNKRLHELKITKEERDEPTTSIESITSTIGSTQSELKNIDSFESIKLLNETPITPNNELAEFDQKEFVKFKKIFSNENKMKKKKNRKFSNSHLHLNSTETIGTEGAKSMEAMRFQDSLISPMMKKNEDSIDNNESYGLQNFIEDLQSPF